MHTSWKFALAGAALAGFLLISCGSSNPRPNSSASVSAAQPTATENSSPPAIPASDEAPPASQTGGFDGAKAYDQVAKLVSFGPHPPDTTAIRSVQAYIRSQLQGFGCAVDEDNFHAQTPLGSLAMDNIVAKIPGTGPGIILLLTHYDTVRLDNFVGAEDGGSSTGLLLEMARVLCAAKQKSPNAVWIAFLDGEEDQQNFETVEQAQTIWNANENTFGSRELAARMELAGELKNVKAVILADMIGQKDLQIEKDTNSTPWLQDLVWKTADRLGYRDIFTNYRASIGDDHQPFLMRGVPALDVIDLNGYVQEGYWHTPQDTLDKISPRNLAIVGHVILESVNQLQQKFH